MRWLNRPEQPQVADIKKRDWEPHYCCHDRLIADAAFLKGVGFHGNAEFEFSLPGEFVLEVFVWGDSPDEFLPYTLVIGDETADEVSQYNQTQMTLVGLIRGPQKFSLRTTSPKYVLTGIRWTSRDRYEAESIPEILSRVRGLMADPFHDGPAERRQRFSLIQLYPRLALSSNPDVRREALVGMARVDYWNFAESLYPTAGMVVESFKRALAVAPGDETLRQTISAACLGQNQLQRVEEFRKRLACESIEPVEWTPALPPIPKSAPEWAVSQLRLKARLDAITRYWVAKRQRPDGQVGGGWGDDVEMLRSWGPQALGLGSEIAAAGLRRMADGVWNSGMIEKGYSKTIDDSEHGSELTADSQPLLAALAPQDPVIRSRLAMAASCVPNWIGRQPDGKWRFRGCYFNCEQFHANPDYAIDNHYNIRAVGLALWHAFLSRDARLIDLLQNWAGTWLAAARQTRHQKPAGLFPPLMRASDGEYQVGAGPWDRQNNALGALAHWNGYSQEAQTSLLLAVYDLTGNRKWLDAAGETFDVLNDCQAHPRYCQEILDRPEALIEWRRLSGDTRFDKLLAALGHTSDAAVLEMMSRDANAMEERIRYNFPMLTSEAIFTDRVIPWWSASYKTALFGGDAPRGERYPNFMVTWPPTNKSVARAVLESTPRVLRFRFFNFEEHDVIQPVRLWRCRAGRWSIETRAAEGEVLVRSEVLVTHRAQKVQIRVPARRESSVSLTYMREN